MRIPGARCEHEGAVRPWAVTSTSGRARLTMHDTGCEQEDCKHSLHVPRCLAFLPCRAADIATRGGLLVGSQGEQEAAGGVGIQRCLPTIPGESEGGEHTSPAWLCKTHTKPENYNTLPGLFVVMGEQLSSKRDSTTQKLCASSESRRKGLANCLDAFQCDFSILPRFLCVTS